jgi:hypothetical protein
VGGKQHASATLPRERPGAHCTGGWVVPRAGLDVWEKPGPYRDSIPVVSGYTVWATRPSGSCCGYTYFSFKFSPFSSIRYCRRLSVNTRMTRPRQNFIFLNGIKIRDIDPPLHSFCWCVWRPMCCQNKTVCYVTLQLALCRCPAWRCNVNRRIWCKHTANPWKWERYPFLETVYLVYNRPTLCTDYHSFIYSSGSFMFRLLCA